MSQISSLPPAQTQMLLTGANFCHSACGISRTTSKWIGGFSLLSLLFSVYRLVQRNKTHESENHKIGLFTAECIDTSCQKTSEQLRKQLRVTKRMVLLCGLIYLASVGAQYLSSKLITHLSKGGQ